MKNVINQLRKEDFIISIRPQLDSKRVWTGEMSQFVHF